MELKLNYNLVEMLSKRETDIKDHILTLYNLVLQLNAKIVVELGAGQSTYALATAVKETGGQFYSIDILEEAHLRGFEEGKGLLEEESRYHFLQGDSVGVANTWGQKIDLLFIDSKHTREHVRAELESWDRFVRIGGKIAMHDTHHTLGHAIGVRVALDGFLEANPGRFTVTHNEACGGFSILTKLKDK